MRRASIRLRLTAWYGGILILALVSSGVAVYFLMARVSLRRVDAMLDFEFREAAERLAAGSDPGTLAEEPAAFHEAYLLRVENAAGRVLAQTGRLRGLPLPAPEGGPPDGPRFHASVGLGPLGLYRVVSGGVATGHGRRVVHVATSLDARREELAELRGVLLTILPAVLLAATGGGYWRAASSLAPIDRMAETARRISSENLGERVAVGGLDDELGRLAATLNAMLDRIDRGFAAARRFTADAAHELRTPVAAIRSEVEVTLLSRRRVEDYEQTLASVLEEATRLGRVADRLLALSREDTGRLDLTVREAAGRAAEAARRSGLRLLVEGLPEVLVAGDVDSLRMVFDNLLDNAVKYTPMGGCVTVRGRRADGRVTVEVVDTGVGIPPDALPRVFDRFFRADPSRSRRTGGSGLGLSIARAAAERHGGTVEVESRPGAGSTFRVTLPARPATADAANA